MYLSTITKGINSVVGANGVGKSSFASFIKGTDIDNVVVITAQKYLYEVDTSYAETNIQNINNSDLIRDLKIGNKNFYIELFKGTLSSFVRFSIDDMLKILADEHQNKITDQNEIRSDKVNNIFQLIFPDITIYIEAIKRTYIIQKGGSEYSINSMSDGEKACLYFILRIIYAPKDSFVVVDEPETYINPSIYVQLWDILEKTRPDISFIYISHSVEFIISRQNSKLLWIKSYNYPNEWELEEIQDNEFSEFPRKLVIELTGSKKSVIFVEGEKNSLDFKIYSSIFQKNAIIYPVQTRSNVINYTLAYNKCGLFSQGRAFGIVDGDLTDKAQIEDSKNKSIYVPPFNEIEMMLVDEELLKMYLDSGIFSEEEASQKLADFKTKFYQKIKGNIDNICSKKAKQLIDDRLSTLRVDEKKCKGKKPDDFKKHVTKELEKFDVVGEIEQFKENIKLAAENENYSELLKLCPLKKEITRELANKVIDHDFENKMVNSIKRNDSFSTLLRKNYFSDLYKEVSNTNIKE